MSVNDILQSGLNFYSKMQTHFLCMSEDEITSSLETIQNNIREMQAVCYKLAKISNVATNALRVRNKRVKSVVDCYPTDYTVESVIYKKQEKLPVEIDINIPIKIVNEISDVPVSYLYYVRSTSEYAVNINGLNITGDLCVISNKKENSVVCNKANCNVVDCSYYHTRQQCSEVHSAYTPRNLPIGSYVHGSIGRKCGSRLTLLKDISEMSNLDYHLELSNREPQLLHDILIYQILHEKSLIKKYNARIDLTN